ncbi:MAG: SDR family oxidoreductase [Eubacteriales bacterium]|nr:SDR family oxidoreductase [Eubacteriales bacterium]
MADKLSIREKKALVTCAAKGIGREYAIALAQAGAYVAVVDKHFEAAKLIAEQIEKCGGRSIAIGADISIETEVSEMMEQLMIAFGEIDIAVIYTDNCIAKSIMETSLEKWQGAIRINLTSMFVTAKAVGMVMIKQGFGSIINTSSLAGYVVSEQPQAAYNTAKAGILHLTRSLAAEWAPYNVRINSISHGYMDCEIRGRDDAKHLLERIPMQRMGKLEELHGALIYLASDASTYTTGIDILVDGGFRCW